MASGRFTSIWHGVKRVGQVQRDVFPDVARQIVAEQVGEIVFGDAIIVPGAWIRFGRSLATATSARSTLNLRHGAGVEAVLLVFQFLLQQVDRRFVHGDLLRGEQHVVIRQAHGQQRVGQGGLILRQACSFVASAARWRPSACRPRKWTGRSGCRRSSFGAADVMPSAGKFCNRVISLVRVLCRWPAPVGSATARVCTTMPYDASRSFCALRMVAFCASAVFSASASDSGRSATRASWCRRRPRQK